MSIDVDLYALAPETLVLPREACAAMVQAVIQMQVGMLAAAQTQEIKDQPPLIRITSLSSLPVVGPRSPDDPPEAVKIADIHLRAPETTLWLDGSDPAAIIAALPSIPFGSEPLVAYFSFGLHHTLYLLPQARPMVFVNAYDGSREYQTSAYVWWLGTQKREPPIYSSYPVSRIINQFFGGIIPVCVYY